MVIRSLSNALSGIRSAGRHLQASSHNVANLLTDEFRPVRTIQSEVREGGSRFDAQRADTPEPVDVAEQFAAQSLAGLQLRASLRVLDTQLGLLDETTRLGRDTR